MENNQNKRIFARVSALTALLTVGVGIDPRLLFVVVALTALKMYLYRYV